MTTGADPNAGVALMNRQDAFRHFAEFRGATQSQLYIRPLHEYVTSRHASSWKAVFAQAN